MDNIQIFDGLFSNEELDWFIQNDIVLNQLENLSDINHKRRFSLNLPENMKAKLQSLGLSEDALYIPMMWINNDMSTHIDSGEDEFKDTILVYISDCQGSLVINNNSYEIKQNRAFKFQKGLEHSTENTGNEPRLLIGPMSESGFPVGASLYYYVDSTQLNTYVPDNDSPNLSPETYVEFGYPDENSIYTLLTDTDFYNLLYFNRPSGATLIGWEGKYGFANNYTQVSYNPGMQLDGLPGNLYLYPVWSQPPPQQQIMCFKEGTNILCFDPTDNTGKKALITSSCVSGLLILTINICQS
jgi:hypothetical protein